MTKELVNQEWYQSLIDDCKSIITEAVFTSRWTLIKGYHVLGKRILEDYDEFKKIGITKEKEIRSRVTKDLKQSDRTIRRAIQFATDYPDLDLLPGGKNTSWHKICNNLLPEPREQEYTFNHITPFDENMFHLSTEIKGEFGDDVLCIDPVHGPEDIREYKEYYPTITRFISLYHPNGKEFSLREYAKVQDFPKDFKFVGPTQEIKNQIGEAVSPKMGEYILNKHITGTTYLEIFAGCGGFSVAAEKLGKKCIWCNDFNRYAGHSYKLNFPETDVCVQNIKQLDEKEIHKKIGDVDFIMGGPPCQGFSNAGPRLGFKEDERNQLYLDFVRFVKEFQPKQFIMENVKEILNFKDEIIKDFEGYNVITEKVNGLDIGMKQKRIRVFFIGNKNG